MQSYSCPCSLQGGKLSESGADVCEALSGASSVKRNGKDTFDVCVERLREAAVPEFRVVFVEMADEPGGGAFLVAVEVPAVGDV